MRALQAAHEHHIVDLMSSVQLLHAFLRCEKPQSKVRRDGLLEVFGDQRGARVIFQEGGISTQECGHEVIHDGKHWEVV